MSKLTLTEKLLIKYAQELSKFGTISDFLYYEINPGKYKQSRTDKILKNVFEHRKRLNKIFAYLIVRLQRGR